MAKQRIPWFDNIKGILIFLVVFAHLMEIYRDIDGNEVVLNIYSNIYSFHMPLFILISGYFYRPNKSIRVIQLSAVFIIWQIINGVFSKLINEGELVSLGADSRILDLFNPYWAMWFLLGILVWGIITQYITRFKYPLFLAIILAFWAGYVDNITTWFSLRKLINFYPYFLIGYLLANKNILKWFADKGNTWKSPLRWGAVITVIASFAFISFFTYKGVDTAEIFFMRDSYGDLGLSLLNGITVQLLMYICVTVLCVALMLLIPQGKKLPLISKFGIYSLYIYLVHTNIVRIFRQFVPEKITENPGLLITVSLVTATIICTVITSKYIRTFFRPLIEPKINWGLKPPKSYQQKEISSS